MNLELFFALMPLTILVLIFVRKFWVILWVIYEIVRLLLGIAAISFALAITCAFFFSDSPDSINVLWLYFFCTVTGIVIVWFFIVSDIIAYAIDFVRSIFR